MHLQSLPYIKHPSTFMDENRKWYLYLPQNISAPTNTNGGVCPHTAVRWHKNTSLNACAQQVNAAHAWTVQSLKWRNKSHFPLVVPTNSDKGLSGTVTEIQCCFFFPSSKRLAICHTSKHSPNTKKQFLKILENETFALQPLEWWPCR